MYHFQSSVNDWPRAVAMLPNGALVKAIDRGDILRDVKGINPHITTMLRHHGPPQSVFDGRGFEAYKQLARDFFATFIDGTFRDQYAAHTDLVQEWNEYLASSHSGAELQDRIDWARAAAWVWFNEYRTQPEYAHIRLALVSAPVGNDIHRTFAEIAIQYDCVLSYHAYDKFVGDHQRDPHSWRYHCGRWHYMEQAWGLKPDWVFGEAGPYAGVLEGWRHPSVLNGDAGAYVEAVRTWIREIKTTPAYAEGRVLGFALFTTGGTTEWKHYETRQNELDALASMIAQEWKPVALPAPPPPPDGIPLPAGVIDYVDALPMNTESEYWPYQTRPLSAIENVVIHHSVGLPTTPPESIAIGHINRGWPAIGYHFYINVDSNGTARIYKTNHLTTHSYHAGTANRSSVGICLAGDFTTAHPSPEQLAAARYLLTWLDDVLGFPALKKHKDFSNTQCPGNTWSEWWSQLTEEPEPPVRQYARTYHLLPQNATTDEVATVVDKAYGPKQSVGFSVDDAFVTAPGLTSRTVYVWDVERIVNLPDPERELERWVAEFYAPVPTIVYRRLTVPAVTPPVGTPEERATGDVWPGEWVSANTYGNRYLLRDVWQYHTGDDLNLNSPSWDSDKGAPVYAVADGVVTYASRFNDSWGRIVVIRHDMPDRRYYSRSAHLARIDVAQGATVTTGQQIGTIGGADVNLPNHLHFDISHTERLATSPGDWPGADLTRLKAHYVNPKTWLQERV